MNIQTALERIASSGTSPSVRVSLRLKCLGGLHSLRGSARECCGVLRLNQGNLLVRRGGNVIGCMLRDRAWRPFAALRAVARDLLRSWISRLPLSGERNGDGRALGVAYELSRESDTLLVVHWYA
jgi:hypothetical protein